MKGVYEGRESLISSGTEREPTEANSVISPAIFNPLIRTPFDDRVR